MKYLLGLAALTFGALAQHSLDLVGSHEYHEVVSISHQPKAEAQQTIFKDPLTEKPEITSEWVTADDGKYSPIPSPEPNEPRDLKHDHERRRQRRQHRGQDLPDHKMRVDLNDAEGGPSRDHHRAPVGTPDYDYEQRHIDEEDQRDDPNFRHHRKIWKGKKACKIFFFIFLGILSLFLVKKCIKKRSKWINRRRGQAQNLTDPAMIEQEIERHYAEIQRLTELRNQLQRQVQVEPIIYHQTYAQEMEMSNASRGRMVNENSYPVNQPQQGTYQNIPVGRPVIFGNPYSNPHIYRGQQY